MVHGDLIAAWVQRHEGDPHLPVQDCPRNAQEAPTELVPELIIGTLDFLDAPIKNWHLGHSYCTDAIQIAMIYGSKYTHERRYHQACWALGSPPRACRIEAE
jgi:hypothetical protein